MENEKIIDKSVSYSLNIAGGKVESLRVKEDLETVIRVYDGGNIGIAGRIGAGDDEKLMAAAQEKLSQNIAYPCSLTENAQREENAVTEIISGDAFVKTIKALVARLNATYPDFIFSNKVNMYEKEQDYSNSKGTHYNYKSNNIVFSLVIKSKASANIMDLDYSGYAKRYNEDDVVSDVGKLLAVFDKKVDLPEETLPVIISADVIAHVLYEIIAEKYVSGASLFNGKLGEKLFSDKLNILIDRKPDNLTALPFFDSEGVVNPDDKFYFIKNGVLSGLSVYKRTGAAFNLPVSGSADADFDAVPTCGFGGVTVATDGVKLTDVVKGKAIYIAVTSGGDMTPDGNFATPVMLAYLYDNGELVGKLPEFGISANVFELLGNDLAAVCDNDVFSYCEQKVLVSKFNINK